MIVELVELLGVAGAVGIGVYGFMKELYGPAARHRQTLRGAKRWPIGELPEDTVGRVIGTARRSGPTLQAPLTGRECLCYLVFVSVGGGAASGSEGRIIIREQRGVTFVLEDGSGRALVDAEGALLERREGHTSHPRGELTEQQLDFLESHGERRHGAGLLTFHEEIVGIGETICVAGAGVREPDPEGDVGEGYRSAPTTRLRLASSPKFQILITDALPPSTSRSPASSDRA